MAPAGPTADGDAGDGGGRLVGAPSSKPDEECGPYLLWFPHNQWVIPKAVVFEWGSDQRAQEALLVLRAGPVGGLGSDTF